MDTTEFNAALVDIPQEDGAIGRAFEELDARIAAWASAVAAAQSAIVGLAEHADRAAELAAARAVAESAVAASAAQVQESVQAAPVQASAPPQVAVPVQVTAPTKVAAPTQAPAPTSATAAEAPKAKTPAPAGKKSAGLRLGHLTEKKADEPTARKGIRVYEEEAPTKADPAAAGNDEDEALLATLDPQVARQIRIKRRLCNNAKSVRALLDEEKKTKKGKK